MAFELFIFIVPLILILLTYTIHHCVFSLCTSVYYTWFLGIVYINLVYTKFVYEWRTRSDYY